MKWIIIILAAGVIIWLIRHISIEVEFKIEEEDDKDSE